MTRAVTTGDLLATHAGVLLDVYGVLFDARGPLPGAAELLAELERRGTPYRIVTNDASRSQATYAQRFAKYGIRVAPERFVTSGSLLPGYIREHGLVGARTLVLGTADSVAFVREGGALALTLPATPPRRPADSPRAATSERDDTEPLFNTSLDAPDDTEPLPNELRPPARAASEPGASANSSTGANLFGASSGARAASEPGASANSSTSSSGANLFGTPAKADAGANLFGTSASAKDDGPLAPLDGALARAATSDVSEQALAASESAGGGARLKRVTDERAHAETGDLTDHVKAIAAELDDANTRDVSEQAARARAEATRVFDAQQTRDVTDKASLARDQVMTVDLTEKAALARDQVMTKDVSDQAARAVLDAKRAFDGAATKDVTTQARAATSGDDADHSTTGVMPRIADAQIAGQPVRSSASKPPALHDHSVTGGIARIVDDPDVRSTSASTPPSTGKVLREADAKDLLAITSKLPRLDDHSLTGRMPRIDVPPAVDSRPPDKAIHAIASAFGDARMIRDDDQIDAIAICDDDGFDFLRGIELALSMIVRAVEAGRTPHLILPNPDLVYPKGGGDLGFTAGAIALLLEAALARRFPNHGLRFTHLGKPQPLLFATAAKQLGLAPEQLVMIGDQLETDIAGARAAGCKSALLAGVSKWEHARDHAHVTPDYLLEKL
ncbi:MAG: HAD hydrolase-like protein [Kofleriaceae bacterium]